jgi:hypothetical protein
VNFKEKAWYEFGQANKFCRACKRCSLSNFGWSSNKPEHQCFAQLSLIGYLLV